MAGLSYVIDANDIIVEVSPDWEAFAQAGNAVQLSAAQVIGTQLFSHIHGDATRMLYRTAMSRVRLLHADWSLAFSCDSPQVSRDMLLEVREEAGARLRFVSTLLDEVQEDNLPLRHREGAGLRRCSVCGGFASRNGRALGGKWHALDLRSFLSHEKGMTTEVDYDVCGACEVRAEAGLKLRGAAAARGKAAERLAAAARGASQLPTGHRPWVGRGRQLWHP